jgi:parallel beta-helix repeat protein
LCLALRADPTGKPHGWGRERRELVHQRPLFGITPPDVRAALPTDPFIRPMQSKEEPSMPTHPAPHNPRRVTITALSTVALFASAAFLIAGPIDPPAGPVAPSYKTLTEVEPRIAINDANTPGDSSSVLHITQPGSYYLTGNITGRVNQHGIKISASGVTIDLNGFQLVGAPSVATVSGIVEGAAGLINITIRNGTVRNWSGGGVNLGSTQGCTVHAVRAQGNTQNGIRTGERGIVTDCIASLNGVGIEVSSAVVSKCVAFRNTSDGITGGRGSTITECVSHENDGHGITGGLVGIDGGGAGGTIIGCVSRNNSSSGIRIGSRWLVLNNTCDNNGRNASDGANIFVIGQRNRIEGNHCTGADRGIDVDDTSNIIIRNTCSGNGTNWTIVAGNAVAPIVNASTNAAAINGNTYAGSLGSTDPNANFTH